MSKPQNKNVKRSKQSSADDAGNITNNEDCEKDGYNLIIDPDDFKQGIYDKPLPCFGCGVGWFS